jgi:hypothetical protein
VTDAPLAAEYADLEELFKINDRSPPPLPSPHFESAQFQDSVEAIYTTVYAPSLDKFLETHWYTTSGLKALRSDLKLLADFVAFFRAADLPQEEPSRPNVLAQESRLIWNLLNMCCTADATAQDPDTDTTNTAVPTRGGTTDPMVPPEKHSTSSTIANGHDVLDPDPQLQTITEETQVAQGQTPHAANEANYPIGRLNPSNPTARLNAVTSLLTSSPPPPQCPDHQLGISPSANPAHPSKSILLTPLARQLKAREDKFWSYVVEYVRAAESGADTAAERKTAVEKARSLLDGRENRDVVWTVMRMRWLQSWGLGLPKDAEVGRAEDVDTQEREKQWEQEWKFCMGVLRDEAGLGGGAGDGYGDGGEGEGDGVRTGPGRNVIAMRLAGMAVRAFAP